LVQESPNCCVIAISNRRQEGLTEILAVGHRGRSRSNPPVVRGDEQHNPDQERSEQSHSKSNPSARQVTGVSAAGIRSHDVISLNCRAEARLIEPTRALHLSSPSALIGLLKLDADAEFLPLWKDVFGLANFYLEHLRDLVGKCHLEGRFAILRLADQQR
jgi:hypothetical protein